MNRLSKCLRVGLGVSFIAVGLMALSERATAQSQGLTVVELYTSQGCSSCPPADALLGKISQRSNILALSFHVDYWDYIGWKDPYAKASYTKRQRGYARAFKKSFVYTPQVVVHGMTETTGSNAESVNAGIRKASMAASTDIRLKRLVDGGLDIKVSAADQPVDAAVWIAIFDPVHETKIRRGENRGRTIKNYNVVREFKKIGSWRGGKLALTVPASELKSHMGRGCAVFLQNENKGPILGAAMISLAPQVSSR